MSAIEVNSIDTSSAAGGTSRGSISELSTVVETSHEQEGALTLLLDGVAADMDRMKATYTPVTDTPKVSVTLRRWRKASAVLRLPTLTP